MELTELLFLGVLAAVGLGRLVEMRISRRHQRALAGQGVTVVREATFPFMVTLHAAVLVGAALEVTLLRRPFVPLLGAVALGLFLMSNALRWWVIAAMGGRWNVQVTSAVPLGVVTGGPFRFIRHPNYVAVFVELCALPLVHGAWLTALLGSALHLVVLRRRIALEESILLADPGYRAAMGNKPRFLPRLSPWPMS